MAEYTIGVDLGQSRDPTAIAIVRKVDGVFQVGHLERIPLRTPYPGVVSHVLRLLGHFRLALRFALILPVLGGRFSTCSRQRAYRQLV